MAMEYIVLNDSSPLFQVAHQRKIWNHRRPLPPEDDDGEAIDGRHVETLREQNLILKLMSVKNPKATPSENLYYPFF